MIINVHPFERGLRIVVGLALMSLAFWGPENPWYLLGFIPLVTGLAGYCPMYRMLGISTNGKDTDSKTKKTIYL